MTSSVKRQARLSATEPSCHPHHDCVTSVIPIAQAQAETCPRPRRPVSGVPSLMAPRTLTIVRVPSAPPSTLHRKAKQPARGCRSGVRILPPPSRCTKSVSPGTLERPLCAGRVSDAPLASHSSNLPFSSNYRKLERCFWLVFIF